MEYEERIKEFKDKKPTKEVFTKHTLTPIKTDDNPYIYMFKEMRITSYFEPNGGFFDLSNDEVLSIMEYYGLAHPEIMAVKINHYTQPCIQGMASMENNNKKTLTLFIPSDKLLNHFGIKLNNMVEASLCLLLHEISHLLGNVNKDKKKHQQCEDEADRFAVQEYKKWVDVL